MFCRKHQSLICKDCLKESHLDHSQDLKYVLSENISEFLLSHSATLKNLNRKIEEINEDITAFINQEKSLKSSEFIRFVSLLKRFR